MNKVIYSSLLLISSQLTIAQKQPNIVVFLVDDMGLMDTSLPFLTDQVGNSIHYPLNDWYRTPNMERMAEQGIRFSTFYAQSVSSPSRISLMTGQNATRHHTTNYIYNSYNNRGTYGPKKWNWTGISKEVPTLPYMLKQAGYKTIHIGKAHFGPLDSEGEYPQNIGFDVNIGGNSNGQPGSYYGEWGYGAIQGRKSAAVPDLEKYHGTKTFLSEALTIEANAQIDKAILEEKPFFLYMAHYAVHAPFQADKRFISNYTDSTKSDKAKAFASLVEGIDKSLGDIMDHLEEKGIADNTLILFLGDNGSDAPLYIGKDWKKHGSSAPLRGMKGTEYEGGMRVPFIACWGKINPNNPNQKKLQISQGSIQSQMGSILDIYPTVLSVAGVDKPKRHVIDGYNLACQLKGEKNYDRVEKWLMHFPHEHRASYFTVYRDKEWKLIYYYNPQKPERPSFELYNLKQDPAENFNMATIESRRVDRMILDMSKQLEVEGALFPEDAVGNLIKPTIKNTN